MNEQKKKTQTRTIEASCSMIYSPFSILHSDTVFFLSFFFYFDIWQSIAQTFHFIQEFCLYTPLNFWVFYFLLQ